MIAADDFGLLQAYLDRRLGESEAAALEARLLAEPALADALVTLAREEAILTEWAKGVRALEHATATATSDVVTAGRGRAWRGLVIGAGVAAAAAVAAVMTFLGGPALDRAGPAALAVLEEVHGEVYVTGATGRVPAQNGQELFAGHELGTSGEGSSATVKYGDDTRLELGADTRVSFEGTAERRVVLEEGVLTGERPGPAAPMVLATPHAEALLRGSHFYFTAAPDATLVEMEDGRARLTRKSDGKAIDLPTGSLVVSKNRPLKPRPLAARVTKVRAILEGGTGPVPALAWARDGRTIFTADADGTVKVWDVGEREVRRALSGHRRPVRGLALAPDESWLAGVSDDKAGQLRVWDLAAGAGRPALKAPKGGLYAVAVSPDGRTIATGGGAGKEGGEVRLWDAATGQDRGVLRGHAGDVVAVAFAPDGRLLATGGSKDNLARLWDLKALRELRALSGHAQRVNAVAFSPDGRTLATASRDGQVRLWDVATGEERRTLQGDGRDVRSVAFSPDGRTLATASGDLARLWDVATGAERVALKGHRGQVAAVAFAPDGKVLATGGNDKTVRLWDVPRAAP